MCSHKFLLQSITSPIWPIKCRVCSNSLKFCAFYCMFQKISVTTCRTVACCSIMSGRISWSDYMNIFVTEHFRRDRNYNSAAHWEARIVYQDHLVRSHCKFSKNKVEFGWLKSACVSIPGECLQILWRWRSVAAFPVPTNVDIFSKTDFIMLLFRASIVAIMFLEVIANVRLNFFCNDSFIAEPIFS